MKKFSSFLVVLLLMLASFTAGVEYQRGDVDQDGQVSISDVTCLIDYLLTGTWGDEPVTPPDTHEYVDLGLPSGTLWATSNIGADNPEDYGDYFAWGETEPKDVYNLDTYKWWYVSGWVSGWTKYSFVFYTGYDYINPGYDGFVDNKTELDLEDDAAYVNWGPSWRMPTIEQFQELCEQCEWQWTTQNGMNGDLVTGPNGNTLFLPAACARWDFPIDNAGSFGWYWSRMLAVEPSEPFGLYLDSEAVDINCGPDRVYGVSVRAVRASQD